METIRIGYVSLSKASWMTPKIDRIMAETEKSLHAIPGAEIVSASHIVTTEAEGEAAARELAAAGLDLVVMHFATFPTGAIIPAVAEGVGDVPIVLLSNPEKPAADGMWEQNSFCGANLGAFVMKRLGKRYGYAHARPEEIPAKLAVYADTVRGLKALRKLRVGLFGGRVPGFYTSNCNEMDFRRKFGMTLEVADLSEVLFQAERLDAKELAEARAVVKRSAARCLGVGDTELELAAKLYGAFRKLAGKYRVNSLAVRCWPEFSDIFGIAPCAILGMLSDTGLPTSCEGDVPGAATMMLLEAVSRGASVPFFMDLISFDEAANTGVVWHCGASPAGIARNHAETTYKRHMRVDGGDKKGLVNEFPLKSGPVTIAKIDQDENGKFRMLIVPGEALDTEPFMRGNPLTIRFAAPVQSVIETVMRNGFEHHYAVIHADAADALEQFCRWLDIEVVRPR